MKNYFISLLLIFPGIFFFSSCRKYPLKSTNDNAVSLYNCSKTTVTSYICFDSLLTDSRCPSGGECVWQGTAIIQVTFHENGNSHTFKMSLQGFPSLGHPSDTSINGHMIVFTDLKPYPALNIPAPNVKDIKATFSILH